MCIGNPRRHGIHSLLRVRMPLPCFCAFAEPRKSTSLRRVASCARTRKSSGTVTSLDLYGRRTLLGTETAPTRRPIHPDSRSPTAGAASEPGGESVGFFSSFCCLKNNGSGPRYALGNGCCMHTLRVCRPAAPPCVSWDCKMQSEMEVDCDTAQLGICREVK